MSKSDKEKKFSKLIGAIVKRFEKKNAKVFQKAMEEELVQDTSSAMLDQMLKVEEWKKICKKINDVAHFIGAELEERGYPCSVSIAPIFHPDTHMTYSSQVVCQVALVQLEELAYLMRRKHQGIFGHKPSREEVFDKALEVASRLSFVEDLTNRQVLVAEKIFSLEEVSFTLSFDEITKKKVKELMEGFILRSFDVA